MKKLTKAKIEKIRTSPEALLEIVFRDDEGHVGKATQHQKNAFKCIAANHFTEINSEKTRREGSSTALLIHALHTVLFDDNKTCVIVFSNLKFGFISLETMKSMYVSLPDELKKDVTITKNNSGEFELSNGSRVVVVARANHLRGLVVNNSYIDFLPASHPIMKDKEQFDVICASAADKVVVVT